DHDNQPIYVADRRHASPGPSRPHRSSDHAIKSMRSPGLLHQISRRNAGLLSFSQIACRDLQRMGPLVSSVQSVSFLYLKIDPGDLFGRAAKAAFYILKSRVMSKHRFLFFALVVQGKPTD